MYDKRAKQDALDLWFSMPGEMSVDDFAAELGYPSGSTLRNWIKADPRHDPDKCQYRSKPVLPKLEAIRRVAEGATAAQAARETGLTPQQVRYSVGRYARGGTAALLPAPARKRRKGEAVDEGKTRRASRPARPMPCEQPPGLPEELPDDPAALKAIIADLELSNAALREVLAVLKAGAPALTNAEAAGCASRLEGAFGAAAACAALGLARSTYYYQLDALTSPSAPPDGTAGEVERAFRVDGNSSRGYRFVREVVSRRRGRPVSEKVVRRLMRGLGLRVCYARRGRYSSYAGEIDAPAPNLLLRADGTHDFSAGRPNEAWVSCHYRWPGWKAICGRHGLARSMSRKGTSPDNAACEGFFGNLKNEFFHGRDWSGWTAEAFMELLDGWMAAYSTVRLKAFREGGRTVYDTIDNRRRRLGLAA
ncbi:helix-turn-helix domain-containing protein [Adlercreutzia rubneri]